MKQHPDVNAWTEMVREYAGDGVNSSVSKAWEVLNQFADMPSGGSPGHQDAGEWAKQKRVQGFKWFNLHGGLDLLWYPRRNTTEHFAPWLRERNFKIIFLERKSSVEMQISTYKHERSVKRLRSLNMTGSDFFCSVGDSACLEKSRDDPISLDVPELMQGLNNIDRIWREYSRWAIEHFDPANVLRVTYDELQVAPQETVNRVFTHLGVPTADVDLSLGTEKMGAGCVRDGLSNPDDVAFALVGTKWEGEVDVCNPSPPMPPAPPPSPPALPPAPLDERWLRADHIPPFQLEPSPSPLPVGEVELTDQVREVFARAKDERKKDVSGALSELAEARAQFARAEEHLAQARAGEQLLKQKQYEVLRSYAADRQPVQQQEQSVQRQEQPQQHHTAPTVRSKI